MGLLSNEHRAKLGAPVSGVNLTRLNKLKDDINTLIIDLHASEHVVEDFVELKMEVYLIVMDLGTVATRIDLLNKAIATVNESRSTLRD